MGRVFGKGNFNGRDSVEQTQVVMIGIRYFFRGWKGVDEHLACRLQPQA